MAEGELAVPDVMLPAGPALWESYKDTLVRHGDQTPVSHELSINGMRVRGRWHLVAVRSDYAIGVERTNWLTFRWAGDA